MIDFSKQHKPCGQSESSVCELPVICEPRIKETVPADELERTGSTAAAKHRQTYRKHQSWSEGVHSKQKL